jgi:hypothetical protein
VAGGGVLLVNSNEKTTCLQLEANGHLRKNKPSAMFSGAKCDAGSAAQTFVFYDATTAAGDMEMADLVRGAAVAADAAAAFATDRPVHPPHLPPSSPRSSRSRSRSRST